VARYGSQDNPGERYGDGGEAIFAADHGQLVKLEEQLSALRPATRPDPAIAERQADALRLVQAGISDADILLHYEDHVSRCVRRTQSDLRAAGDPQNVGPVVAALGVFLLDKNLRRLLADNDPKAFEQALRAIGARS
jgi:hypothetical protein